MIPRNPDSTLARVCPVCHGVRGLRGEEGPGEFLCRGANECLEACIVEIHRLFPNIGGSRITQ